MRRSIVRRATYSARPHAARSGRPAAGGGEESCTVARVVGRGGTAVGHPGERLECIREDLGGALARRPSHEADAARILLSPGVQVRRAAVGPVRSPAVRHHCSWVVAQKEGPLSFGSGPGYPSLTAPYAARSLPPEGQAGIRVGFAFAAQRFTWYLPDEMWPDRPDRMNMKPIV